jgi:hypothetical protein
MGIEVRAEQSIAAPIELIWEIMIDLKGYAEWNPFITRVLDCERITAVGQRFRLNVTWSNGKGAVSGERVTDLHPPRNGEARLAYVFTGWMSSIGMIRAERVQTLRVLDKNTVRYSTGEAFNGWGAKGVPIADVKDGFERHAAALKRHAEARAK